MMIGCGSQRPPLPVAATHRRQTAAAVASIAFNDAAAAVDGNVIRVVSRWAGSSTAAATVAASVGSSSTTPTWTNLASLSNSPIKPTTFPSPQAAGPGRRPHQEHEDHRGAGGPAAAPRPPGVPQPGAARLGAVDRGAGRAAAPQRPEPDLALPLPAGFPPARPAQPRVHVGHAAIDPATQPGDDGAGRHGLQAHQPLVRRLPRRLGLRGGAAG